MSKSREALIKRLNQLHEQLDNLPPEIVDRLADGNPPDGKYETGEVIQRLAIEVRYLRLHNKLYGCLYGNQLLIAALKAHLVVLNAEYGARSGYTMNCDFQLGCSILIVKIEQAQAEIARLENEHG